MRKGSEGNNADDHGDKQAQDGEDPNVHEARLDMILDIDVGETDTEKGRGNHGADKGGAVAADDHGNRDWQGFDAEGLADADHDGQHAVEVGVGIEGQGQRHGQNADDQRELLAESGRQNSGDHVGKAAHHGGQRVSGQLHDLGGDDLTVGAHAGGQDAHEDGRAHQGGAHHQGRARMEVDDLLVHLGGEAVVDEECGGTAEHEGIVAGEDVPDQHGNDGDGQENVEEEEIGPRELLVGGDNLSADLKLNVSLSLGKRAVQTGAAGAFHAVVGVAVEPEDTVSR